jgi:hypothetical protein
MRTFVESSGLLGNPADQTMGNTPALQAAQNALKHMACAIAFDGKTKAEVGTALSKALLVFCNVSALAYCLQCTECNKQTTPNGGQGRFDFKC